MLAFGEMGTPLSPCSSFSTLPYYYSGPRCLGFEGGGRVGTGVYTAIFSF